MYGKEFCKVYNEFGWNYYPENFGQQLNIWLKNHRLSPKRALDIGCGTGVLCRIMAESGMEVCGVDLSEEMINIAKDANPTIDFYVGDMVTFTPKETPDLVTCTGDALNHLPKVALIEEMFKNVYSYMPSGGVFIFDILNGREGSDDEPFRLDYSDSVYAILRITKADGVITLHVSTYENDILQFEEKIVETYYDPDLIISMLEGAGFRDITCADALNPDSPCHGTTLSLTARKP